MKRHWIWGGLALIAAAGCGGGSGGGNASAGHLLRYGAVSSPVMDSLAKTLGTGGFSPGQTVRTGDVVVLDGDAVSPAGLAADKEIDRILASGASVLLTDAKEAHKESMRGAGRAGASVEGDSHALLFSPFRYAGGRRGVYLLDLAAGDREMSTKEVVQNETGTVQGSVQKNTSARRLTEPSMMRFAARVKELTEVPWTDPLASTVPPEVSWMSAPFELIESADDAALNGQSISESIRFVFRGFSSPPAADGPGANTILVEHYGEVVNGKLMVPPGIQKPGGDHPHLFQISVGWFLTDAKISVDVDRTNPSGQAFEPGATITDVNGDSYQSRYAASISYFDASRTVQTWGPDWRFPDPPQAISSWSLTTQQSDPVFKYFQTQPFDASLSSPNYFDYYDKAKNNFRPMPDASVHQLNLWGAGEFRTTRAVDGPVRFNLRVGRSYTKVNVRFKFPVFTPPSEAGGVVIEEDGNRPFVIDLAQCRPATQS
ncbi:hypothetical protein EON79_16345 [bacterium]|nr:MAG: hypothetical protein EON79_16345 [bacterium]